MIQRTFLCFICRYESNVISVWYYQPISNNRKHALRYSELIKCVMNGRTCKGKSRIWSFQIFQTSTFACIKFSVSIFIANLSPTLADTASSNEEFNEEGRQKPVKNSHNSSKVSFEDSLTLWKAIATSNPSTSPLHALSEHLKTDHKTTKSSL